MDTAKVFASGARARWIEDLRVQAVRGVNFGRAFCTCPNAYHASWGVFRAAGYKVALKREEPILGPILSEQIKDGTRILIAGSADTGVLCVTGRAAGARTPEITVLDRCAAPLRVIDQFVAERGLPCRTLHADLLELDAEECFDVAVLHYTLWYIEPSRRLDALRRLARSLVKGGTLICCVRMGLGKWPQDIAALAAQWLDDVGHPDATAQLELPLTAAELGTLLRRNRAQTQKRAATIPTAEDIKQLLPAAGYVLTGETETTRHLSPEAERAGVKPAESGSILTAVRL
jgi:SAM-dependent methyltransferase